MHACFDKERWGANRDDFMDSDISPLKNTQVDIYFHESSHSFMVRVSSVVKVRVRCQIPFYDFVAVPASDRSAELPPEQDS